MLDYKRYRSDVEVEVCAKNGHTSDVERESSGLAYSPILTTAVNPPTQSPACSGKAQRRHSVRHGSV